MRRKIRTLPALLRIIARAKAAGKRIAFTNGCFDLLHAGHAMLLERAKNYADILVVGLNSDRSVRALKGSDRPVNRQRDRACLLAALESVDYVVIFDAPTPERIIQRIRPHVLIKGADWPSSKIVGSDAVHRNGGRVVRLTVLKGYSTSGLIKRIKQSV